MAWDQQMKDMGVSETNPIDEYPATTDPEKGAVLEKLRQTTREIIPEATETIICQIPKLKLSGRALVGFPSIVGHCSFFPYSSTVLGVFSEELTAYRTSKGALRP